MNQGIRRYWLGIFLSLIFFVIGVVTINDYGLNIDEPIHFIRGQAYLNLLLTGRKEYSSQDLSGKRISAWKIQQYNATYFLKNDSGHPALNGILAAATNRIFFETLGVLGDLASYHVFEIAVSSFLVFVVYVMTAGYVGRFAGVIAALSVMLYPLFFGESRFNIKDPLEATFFASTIYFLFLGVERKMARYFLYSSVACALAFGTKFNIVFVPFILVPYSFVRFLPAFRRHGIGALTRIPKNILLALLAYPVIVLGIHLMTRPYLWQDPIGRFLEIVRYYEGIGTGKFYRQGFIVNGWNTYPVFFVTISTPLVILGLAAVGAGQSLWNIIRKKDATALLVLVWFIVPILRVSLPGTSIYSGIRQILEYLPAMAILSGVGAVVARRWMVRIVGDQRIGASIIVLVFVPLVFTLARLHPNENIFLNTLVGGVAGAVKKDIPGAAETMGNVYLAGVRWMNKNLPQGARFGLPVGLLSNIPMQFLRSDIVASSAFSGEKQAGEYMMEMFSVDFPPPRYNVLYLDKFLEPVYEVTVDGVVLLKIWKNDREHTRPAYRGREEQVIEAVQGGQQDGFLRIILQKPARATKLEIDYIPNDACVQQGSGQVFYSPDGEKQFHLDDDLFNMQGPYASSLLTSMHYVYFFPAVEAKTLTIIPNDQVCLLRQKHIRVYGVP